MTITHNKTFQLPTDNIPSLPVGLLTRGEFDDGTAYSLAVDSAKAIYMIDSHGALDATSERRNKMCGFWSIELDDNIYNLFVETPNRKPTDAFTYTKNGKLILTNPDYLSPKDWDCIAGAFNMLGYGLESPEIARSIFTRLSNENPIGYILQPDQQLAVEKLIYHKEKSTNWEEKAKMMEAKAIQHFGLTENHEHAGYITRNGSMLNFSHEGYQRDMDHRDINEIFEDDEIERDIGSNTAYMIQFMNLGNIRTSDTGLDIAVPPTDAQKRVIRNKCRELFGDIYIDFSSPTGSTVASRHFPYGTPIAAIIYTIDAYFETGFLPGIDT